MQSTKFVGMDVDKETSSIAVLNFEGKVIIGSIIETKTMTILQFMFLWRRARSGKFLRARQMPGDIVSFPEKGGMLPDTFDDFGLFREQQLGPVLSAAIASR